MQASKLDLRSVLLCFLKKLDLGHLARSVGVLATLELG